MEERSKRNDSSEGADLVQQLRDKVRSQATRLRGLEQYKVLCEQRINELLPGHNFPVRPEDLGCSLPPQSSQELQLAKQKIARLEQQLTSQSIKVPLADNYIFPPPSTQLTLAQLQELYSAIYYQQHELSKEKSTVEESLRAEMLICEEQRAYIEILKQALESNLQELGMTGRTIEDILSRNERPGVKDNEEVNELSELLKIKTDECEQLIQERMKTDAHLKEAAEALQYAEEEVERLEEEKSALLDYIDGNCKKSEGEDGIERKLQETLRELNTEQNVRKDLENELENIRMETSRNEKAMEAEVEKIKANLVGFEQKNESLQVNNTTLANMLKETQEELDSLRSQHDISIKEVSTIRRTLSVSESKLEEAQRLADLNKELQSNMLKAEKELKVFKERKIKEIENEYKSVQEQLTVDIEDLRAELERVVANEKKLARENSELIKKTKKINDESAKMQLVINQNSLEISELKKALDTAQISYRQISFEKDKINADLQRSEFNLSSEKSSKSDIESELKNLIEKLAENAKKIKELNDSHRDKDNKLANNQLELENVKKNLSLSLQDAEGERSLKTQYYEEVLKLKKSQGSFSKFASEIEDCKRIITLFASNFGAVSSASTSYSSIISSQFKDILFKSNDPSNINVSEWVQNTCEELEALIRRLSEYKQELANTSQKLVLTQHRIDSLSIDENSYKSKERSLRLQVDALELEKSKIQNERDILMNKLQNNQNEVSALRKELQCITEEGQRLRDQLNYSSTESVQWRNSAETDIHAIKAIEEKANLLMKEKKELEILIGKLQSAVPSSDLQRVFLELMKCHSELEVIHREKLRIEAQLLRSEGEMRSHSRNHQQDKAIQVRKEVESLRTQLNNCESQVSTYKRRMITLEEEMKDIEKCERRRVAFNLETEKGFVQAQGDLEYKSKELLQSQLSLYDLKRKQDSIEKNVSVMSPQGFDFEDRPLLSYFDKLRRGRNMVADLKDED